MNTTSNIQIVSLNELHNMTEGLVIVRIANFFSVQAYSGIGVEATIYTHVGTERRAMNAAAKVLKCNPSHMIAAKA